MRLAVISDIHGNAHALEAVLADIETQSPDLTVNLGDHFSGPLEAGRTADILTGLDLPSIAGNHDRLLIDPPNGTFDQWEVWALEQLSEAHLDWVRALPATRVVADEVFMSHATPTDDATSWLDAFIDNNVQAPVVRGKVEALGAGCDYPVILCGHTHTPRMVTLTGGRLVVNPGAVGCPGFHISVSPPVSWSAGAPHARYAILDKSRAGWSVSFRAVPYDYAAAAKVATARGSVELAKAITTGWVDG